MDYQTFQPGQELSSFFKCYWTLESSPQENPEIQTIVPDITPDPHSPTSTPVVTKNRSVSARY